MGQVDKVLGQLLKEAREDQGLRQVDLAMLVRMKRQKISRIESGRSSVKVHEVDEVARALGLVFVFALLPKEKQG